MWLRRLAELGRGIVRTVFPTACLICDVPEDDDSEFRYGLCSLCFNAVVTDPLPACIRCAASVGPHVETSEGCMVCRSGDFRFDTAFRLGVYDGRLRDAIHRLKWLSGEGLAEMLGRIYCHVARDKLRASGVEVVVPVPLHWRRWWTRGYNQATAIGRELALGIGVPFRHTLRRIRYTPQQNQPSAAARRENVRGAFRMRNTSAVLGRCVLLVDDVMTTGSTCSEAARTLLAAGAARVVVAVLARR